MPIDPTLQAAIDALSAAAASEEAADMATLTSAMQVIADVSAERDALLIERASELSFLTAQRDSLDARITAIGG